MAPANPKLQGYGEFLCRPCNVRFVSKEALMNHKAEKRARGSEKHIHCKFCGVDFTTEEAEISHIQECHPHTQELDCPGCGRGPFSRISHLMAHIESGECTRIDIAKIEAAREKKQEFPQKLEALTQGPVRGNYAKFMPSNKPDNYTTTVPWAHQEEQKPPKFEENDFPKLNGQAGAGNSPSEDAVPNLGSLAEQTKELSIRNKKEPSAWAEQENVFPKAAPAQRPTKEQLKEATGPSARQVYDYLDPDDPDHPSFNTARYFCLYSETFACPRKGCMKGFKKAGGLIAHLRSPAHGDKTYICPYCYKRFKTLAAVTAHSESSSLRCNIRASHEYNAYLDQLTGGIIDVDPDHHDDGTLIYHTSESSRKMFGNGGRVAKPENKEGPAKLVQW